MLSIIQSCSIRVINEGCWARAPYHRSELCKFGVRSEDRRGETGRKRLWKTALNKILKIKKVATRIRQMKATLVNAVQMESVENVHRVLEKNDGGIGEALDGVQKLMAMGTA